MASVFISYRREDSADAAGRIYDKLSSTFGNNNVFLDVDDIPFGIDFRDHLSKAVQKCDVVLVIIGNSWLDIKNADGGRRLDDPNDFVNIEVGAALERNIPVIPVMVGSAGVPKENELPGNLKKLAYRNAATVKSGPSFTGQIDRLIEGIESISGLKSGDDQYHGEDDMAEQAASKSDQTTKQESTPVAAYAQPKKKSKTKRLLLFIVFILVILFLLYELGFI